MSSYHRLWAIFWVGLFGCIALANIGQWGCVAFCG